MTTKHRALTVIDDDSFFVLKMIPNVMTKRIPKEQMNHRTLPDFYRECLDILAKQIAIDIIEIRDEMKGMNNE